MGQMVSILNDRFCLLEAMPYVDAFDDEENFDAQNDQG